MAKLNKLVEQYNLEYSNLFLEFSSKRNLPLDPDLWPEADQTEWFKISDELAAKLDKASEELRSLPLDEQEDEDWYMIDITIDTLDGPEYETVDVRKVPLERLKGICEMFPKYNEYYFQKVANSL
jgi:hypothetical protein